MANGIHQAIVCARWRPMRTLGGDATGGGALFWKFLEVSWWKLMVSAPFRGGRGGGGWSWSDW